MMACIPKKWRYTMSKCPHCTEEVTNLNLKVVTLSDETWGTWRGITYSCPSCEVVLSAGFDPVALESDLVKAVVKALRTGSTE
jgi:hypothetical protein